VTELGVSLAGKKALVTGGTRGLGAAIAARLAAAGVEVVVSARTVDDRAGLPFIQADMSDTQQVAAVAEQAQERLGRVDLLVSNAGHQTRRPEGIFSFTEKDWAQDLAVNLMAAIRLDRLLVPAMVERGEGSVLHVSSLAARMPRPASLAYSVSKAALEVYSKGLANQVAGHGVRVNVISPGLIRTSATEAVADEQDLDTDAFLQRTVAALAIPVGRAGTADELATLATFLLSSDASYLTGGIYNVDGGQFPTV
jgi:NAD(P)-dependent dehydrogenase (short-subunit alcohol dehydrogenase family)